MDAFAEALGALRVQAATLLRLQLVPGRPLQVPRAADGAPPRLVAYQVLEGRCALQAAGARADLEAGAFALLARGDAHRVEAQEACTLAGVELEVDTTASLRLLAVLPPLASLPASGGLQALASTLLALAAHPAPASPGADAVLRRMAEALLVQAIAALADREPWLRWQSCAGCDAIVQRCLALMYRRPEAPWTLPSLAREVHTSRSVLAQRFAAVVGEPPMLHLTRWRLGIACRLLRDTPWTMVRIAEAVGYRSEAAFCRAFRRHCGVPPAAWRRAQARAAPLPRTDGLLAVA